MSTGTPIREARKSPLETAAFLLLLTVVACRPFLNEMPSRTGMLRLPAIMSAHSPWQAIAEGVELAELGRVAFAAAIFVAALLWAVSQVKNGKKLALAGWGTLAIVFAGLGLASALRASDRVSAMEVWLEQASFLTAAFVLAQLCRNRWRFALLVIALAAVGGTLAAKGLWQRGVEIPERIAEFQDHAPEQMKQLGITPGTPGAAMLETRVYDPSLTGFLGLSNPFASIMLVLLAAAAGLAADRLIAAVRQWRASRGKARPGEVPLPLLSAGIATVVAALAAATLLMTHSRGAIASAALAVCGCGAAIKYRNWLSARWRKSLLALAGLFVLGAAGTAAYGLAHDRLPTLTMTFRWYYWTATAGIVRDNPVWGVGAGNFPDAYLVHRRAEAEEEIKAPHNVILHSLAQFGVPGGAAYLGLMAWMLFAIARPRRAEDELAACGEPDADGPGVSGLRGQGIALLVMMMLGVFAARAVLGGTASNAYLLILEGAGPAAVLAILFAVFAWAGQDWLRGDISPGPITRVALAGGLFAFVLHSMVEFGPWMAGPGLTFWAAAGGLAGYMAAPADELRIASRESRMKNRRLANAIAATAIAALAGFAVYLMLPVVAKTGCAMDVARSLAQKNGRAALVAADKFVDADPRDNLAPAEAARLCLAICGRGSQVAGSAMFSERLKLAGFWAGQAIERSPAHGDSYLLAADVMWLQIDPNHLTNRPMTDVGSTPEDQSRIANRESRIENAEGFGRVAEMLAQAVARNPQEARLRAKYAESLLLAGKPAECLAQIDAARRIDSKLLPQSVVRLSQMEREELDTLARRAKDTKEVIGNRS